MSLLHSLATDNEKDGTVVMDGLGGVQGADVDRIESSDPSMDRLAAESELAFSMVDELGAAQAIFLLATTLSPGL